MIYHVFANRSNIGDWLSAKAIQALLAPLKVVELLCDDPFVPETLHRLSQATEHDFIVIGGGGLFMEYFAPFWEGFEPISRRVPFAILGVGACDLKRENSFPPRGLLRNIVARAELCSVRDELTRLFLGLDGIPPAVPCPTLAVVPRPRDSGFGVLHVDALDNVGERMYDHMSVVAKGFARETGRSYCSINNLIQSGDEDALDKTLDQYRRVDLIITGRLHACIVGISMGRKVLAVSGDNKIECFMEAAGLGQWVCGHQDPARVGHVMRNLDQQAYPAEFVSSARREIARLGTQLRSAIASIGIIHPSAASAN